MNRVQFVCLLQCTKASFSELLHPQTFTCFHARKCIASQCNVHFFVRSINILKFSANVFRLQYIPAALSVCTQMLLHSLLLRDRRSFCFYFVVAAAAFLLSCSCESIHFSCELLLEVFQREKSKSMRTKLIAYGTREKKSKPQIVEKTSEAHTNTKKKKFQPNGEKLKLSMASAKSSIVTWKKRQCKNHEKL